MTKIAKEFSYLKIKDEKLTTAEHSKKYRDKNKDDDVFLLLQKQSSSPTLYTHWVSPFGDKESTLLMM